MYSFILTAKRPFIKFLYLIMLLFFFSCFFFFFDIQYNLFFLNLNIILLKFVFDISLHQFGFFKILILLFQTPILSFPLIFPFIRPSNNLITVSFFSFFFFHCSVSYCVSDLFKTFDSINRLFGEVVFKYQQPHYYTDQI